MSEIAKKRIGQIEVSLFSSVSQAAAQIICFHLDGFNNAIAINPEKLVRMRHDRDLLQASKAASINYADGIGVCMALGARSGQKIARIPGIELWEELMHRSTLNNVPVFILGGTKAINNITVEKLRAELGVNVVGQSDGYFDNHADVIEAIRNCKAKIISVALGSPKQELFIEKCREAGLTGFFMGVGGSYDVFSGRVERAPESFRNLGLEWLYRMLHQPSRIFRQKNLVTFVLLYLRRQL